MAESIGEIESALQKLGRGSPWDGDTKVSDGFLDPLFRAYFGRLELPNLMAKKNFYELASFVPEDEIDSEVRKKLDAIAEVAGRAKPGGEPA